MERGLVVLLAEIDWIAYAGWSTAVAAVLVVLAWVVVRIRTRFRGDDDPAASDRSMLLQLRDWRREGDLSEEEYRSIKRALSERIEGDVASGPQVDTSGSPADTDSSGSDVPPDESERPEQTD